MATKKLKKILVSYLIVNYKQKIDLDLLITSLPEKSFGVEYEILIFDNSTELNSKDYPYVFSLGKNIGYGRAVNFLSQKAVGEYLVIMNPDVNILRPLISAFKKYKKLSLQKGLLGLGQSEKVYSLPLLTYLSKKRRFSGYAFIIHKNLFKSIGGFNPEYFMYFEDSDLNERLYKLGIKAVNLRRPFVSHKKTYVNISSQLRKYFYYESLLLFLKDHRRVYYFLFSPLLIFLLKIYTHARPKNK